MATTPTQIPFDNNAGIVFKKADKPASEEPKKKWTAEEVEEMAQVTMKSFGWEGEIPKKEKKAEKPSDEPAKNLSTPENEPKPKEEAPAKPAKKPAPKSDEPDMADKIAAVIKKDREETAQAISDLTRKQKEENAALESSNGELDSEDKHQLEVFAAMAKMPGVESDLPKKFEKFFKLQESYQAGWEKENPGKVYDPDADEHADWYEANQPAYDERKYSRAQTEVAARKIVAEKEAEQNARHAVQTALSVAESSIESSSEALEEGIKKQLEEFVGENSILETPGPISKEFQKTVASLTDKITTASVLMTPGTGIQFDVNNSTHKAIQQDVIEFDADIAALDESEQRKMVSTALGKKSRLLGKTFMSMAQYAKLSEADRAKHWSVATEPALVAKLMTVKAKTEIEGWVESIFKQVGKKKEGQPASQSTQAPAAKTFETPSPAVSKPSAPASGSGAASVTSQSGSPSKGENSWEDAAKAF